MLACRLWGMGVGMPGGLCGSRTLVVSRMRGLLRRVDDRDGIEGEVNDDFDGLALSFKERLGALTSEAFTSGGEG